MSRPKTAVVRLNHFLEFWGADTCAVTRYRGAGVARYSTLSAQDIATVLEQRKALLEALERMRAVTNAIGNAIDAEADLDRDDKPNFAMRLSTRVSRAAQDAYEMADAAITKARR